MIGAGIQLAGVTGGGLGEVNAPLVPPTPLPGAPLLTIQGDYEFDYLTGDIKRESTGRHVVLMAIRTAQGSASADPTFGLKMPRKIGLEFANDVKASLRGSLSDSIRDGLVRLDDVPVTIKPLGVVDVRVEFTDLQPTALAKTEEST
jgi:hypothetical protein